MFEGLDSSFLLGVVSKVDKQSTHTVMDVTVVKAEGGPGEEDDTAVSGQSVKVGVRVKFFNLAEGDLNLDGYMPKVGGEFTGPVVINYEEDGYYSTPLEIIGDFNQSVLKFWSHGGIETTLKNFRDNELVTKAYVDGKTDNNAVTCEQVWNNASWNTDNMVDALVSQIKVHNDRTALVLNKNGIDTNLIVNWETKLAPYPSYLGIKIDEEIYFVEVEFTGKGGTNNRGYNFKILTHNLPDNVANGTAVGICASYTPEPLTVADYNNFMPDGGTVYRASKT